MQLTKTIILKRDVPDNDLAELLESFSQGMNYASKFVFDIGKPIGSRQIQKGTYVHLRNNLNQKSQMACNVARQVSGASLRAVLSASQTRHELFT
jgi:predicted transposase